MFLKILSSQTSFKEKKSQAKENLQFSVEILTEIYETRPHLKIKGMQCDRLTRFLALDRTSPSKSFLHYYKRFFIKTKLMQINKLREESSKCQCKRSFWFSCLSFCVSILFYFCNDCKFFHQAKLRTKDTFFMVLL